MSLDIAKYPTLALAENPEELRMLPKKACRSYVMNSGSICSPVSADPAGILLPG